MGIGEKCSAFGNFLWNSEEKTVLGRGGKSWGQIGFFYLIYYICLAGFFVGMLSVFYKTLDESRPKLTGMSSLLKGNPGMGFQPVPDVEYTLVRYRVAFPETYETNTESFMKVLKPYLDAGTADEKKGIDCTPDTHPKDDEFCRFDTASLIKECNLTNNFGYNKHKQPCVLMRLNRIFDWMPEKYTQDNIMGSGASPELQEKILENPDMIYVDCIGENPADRDNIGQVRYFPTQGFSHKYYPFKNQEGYLSPLVFVKFMNPAQHMAMMVECRALAPNIEYDRTEKEGGVHFELLVD